MAATTYTTIYDAMTGQTLVKQVTIAVLAAALAVLNESAATPNHTLRLDWAAGVRGSPATLQGEVQAMLAKVMSDSRIFGNLAGYTDADVQAVVNGLVGGM